MKTLPSKRMWRTLIRVILIEDDGVWITLPSWNPRAALMIKNEEIPKEIVEIMLPGKRLHARCNTGNEYIYNLVFSDWEKE